MFCAKHTERESNTSCKHQQEECFMLFKDVLCEMPEQKILSIEVSCTDKTHDRPAMQASCSCTLGADPGVKY